MEIPKIFESEYRFCLLLWAHEPIKSGELVKLCREQLNWKSSTTYTVIKRLSDRGVLLNQNSLVISLVSKAQAQAAQLEELLDKTFEGSLPAFVAAFTRTRKPETVKEIEAVQQLLDAYRSDLEIEKVHKMVYGYWEDNKDDSSV